LRRLQDNLGGVSPWQWTKSYYLPSCVRVCTQI
jgi:hypothetical protein